MDLFARNDNRCCGHWIYDLNGEVCHCPLFVVVPHPVLPSWGRSRYLHPDDAPEASEWPRQDPKPCRGLSLGPIVERGLGAVPLIELKFRCTACGSCDVGPKVNSAAAGRMFVAPRKDGL
jgi:hypothetical protein